MIQLLPMTKELCRTFMREFEHDPALFIDPNVFKSYIYDQDQCDAYFERHRNLGRIHLAVMLQEIPIGEVILKKIDYGKKHCTLGISMKNDHCKNRGYGTTAERLVLQYAFEQMGMETVFADALLHNARSIHVLKKVGFQETHRDNQFCYFCCDKKLWKTGAQGDKAI